MRDERAMIYAVMIRIMLRRLVRMQGSPLTGQYTYRPGLDSVRSSATASISWRMYQDDQITRYLGLVINRLRCALGDRFLGFYVYGSLVTDAFLPGWSDIDALTIVTRPMTDAERLQVREEIASLVVPLSVRGLDLGIACVATACEPNDKACWELMLQIGRTETGQRTQVRERHDPRLPLDLALARHRAAALAGPPVGEVVGLVPPASVLAACTDNVRRWAARSTFSDPSSGVLNACRAWQYLEEGTLASKGEGGEWALGRGDHRDLIEGALAQSRGEDHELPPDAEIKRFFQGVLSLLETARL